MEVCCMSSAAPPRPLADTLQTIFAQTHEQVQTLEAENAALRAENDQLRKLVASIFQSGAHVRVLIDKQAFQLVPLEPGTPAAQPVAKSASVPNQPTQALSSAEWLNDR